VVKRDDKKLGEGEVRVAEGEINQLRPKQVFVTCGVIIITE